MARWLFSFMLVAACSSAVHETRAPVASTALEPEVVERTEPYEVTGETAEELRASLNERGPVDEQGRHDAITRSYVTWSYDFDKVDQRCALMNVKVVVTSHYVMPEWKPERASPELVTKWRDYVAALMTHERGHTHISFEAGRAVAAALSRLPALANCQALDALAKTAAQAELNLARSRDLAYDADSQHGETQGARF